jgi:hypothetical protein
LLTTEVLLHDNAQTSHCCHNCESLELLGLGNSSTSTIEFWSSTCSQRWKSTSEVSPLQGRH